MGARKLTGFGKSIIALMFLVPGSVVGEMALSSYATKEQVTKALEITNPFSTGFRLTNKTHHASIFSSKGEFDINYENRCNGEFEQIGRVNYEIKHVPFSNDQLFFRVSPSRSVSSRVYFDLPAEEVFLVKGSGSVDSVGDIDASFESAPVKWVNGESGDFYNLARFQGTYATQGKIERILSAVSREVIASTDSGEKTAEVVLVNGKINKKSSSIFTLGVSAEKIKSQTFFSKNPSITITSEAEDNSINISSSIASELVSYEGNPLEKVRVDSSFKINDADSLKKLTSIINSTCQGRFIDEESRVELRLLATKIVDGGVSLGIQPIYWDGPRGKFEGRVDATVKKVIDQNTGLPDFKRGITITAGFEADDLYQKAVFFDSLTNAGFAKLADGKIKMNVTHGDLITRVNDNRVTSTQIGSNVVLDSIAFTDKYLNLILGVK